jgi:hypothetical protein
VKFIRTNANNLNSDDAAVHACRQLAGEVRKAHWKQRGCSNGLGGDGRISVQVRMPDDAVKATTVSRSGRSDATERRHHARRIG